jgi:hypothetical protein
MTPLRLRVFVGILVTDTEFAQANSVSVTRIPTKTRGPGYGQEIRGEYS